MTVKRYDVAALVLYVLLTLVLALPLPCELNTTLAGWSADAYINPWADWWTKKALTEGLDFYHTDYVFYPQGTSLVFHSFSHANTALSLLLTPLMGSLAAYNGTVLLAYALSGFGMYLLVSHLTGCRSAAFVAGLVFAFHPYHIFESDHPVLVTTQWMPLFALALMRLLHDAGASRIKQTVLAALWFLLTALSSWHLMAMLAGWTVLYLLYSLLTEQAGWVSGAARRLILLAILVGLAVAPLLWPILREQLTSNTSYMAVDVEQGLGNDVLSFFVPNPRHPLLGPLVSEVNQRIGFTSQRSGYLGYVCLGLAVVGVVTAPRKTRFWLLTGLVFLVLSLGSQMRLAGVPLHTFQLPWAVPIVGLLRRPFRLNVLLFFSLAVLVGFGSRGLYDRVAALSKSLSRVAPALVAVLVLFEYLVYPFPTIRPTYSPFLHRLAQEEEGFAVADLPMGRQPGKYHLFCQMIHGKKIADGHVSRTPDDAYAFIRGDSFWAGLLENGDIDVTLGDVSRRLAYLSQNDIRYIIMHRDLLSEDKLARWRDYFTINPLYEDDLIVVYRTSPELGRDFELASELGDGVGLIGWSVAPLEITQAGSVFTRLHWSSRASPGRDLRVCLALVRSEVGEMSQEECWDPVNGWPTSEWPAGAVGVGEYAFQVDPHLPGGAYTLVAGLVEPETRQSVGVPVPLETIVVEELPRMFDTPAVQHVTSATFGQDLRLLGYYVAQEDEALRLTLYWQARRRMNADYRMFAHLLDVQDGGLVAQVDVMPRGWTYPTLWWEAGEIVADEMVLPMAGVTEGRYTVAVGVYDSQTGERLPVGGAEGVAEPSGSLILQEVTVP
ncbi:MAG: hypothetical protein ACE5OS_02655 [Anaerolineae bacterium]